jgi:hypothetical protein
MGATNNEATEPTVSSVKVKAINSNGLVNRYLMSVTNDL